MSSTKGDAPKREVKTLEEWIQAETKEKEKPKSKDSSSTKKVETKSDSVTQTKTIEEEQAIPEVKAPVDPSKIKTVLFLKPGKAAASYQDWLQGDSSRISTVWPKDPEPVLKKTLETPADSKTAEKFEFDKTFRKILSE